MTYAFMMMLMMLSCCAKEPTSSQPFKDAEVRINGEVILCPCGKTPNHIYINNGIEARCMACLEGEIGYCLESCFWYEDYLDEFDAPEEWNLPSYTYPLTAIKE